MSRKLLIISIVCCAILTFSNLAWSSVVGSWDVTGTAKVKVSIKKLWSPTIVADVTDEFTFYDDGNFDMIDMAGTWGQPGKSFIVHLNPVDVETYFEDALGSSWLNADVTVTQGTFKVKESKAGDAISGKYAMKMTLYLYDYDLVGKVTASFTFKGTRAATGLVQAETVPLSPSFSEFILERVHDLIPLDR